MDKMNKLVVSSLLVFLLFSCNNNKSAKNIAKDEILNAEKNFAELCQKEGLEVAFTTFADENAFILLNDKLLKGKEQIKQRYHNDFYKRATLQWAPDFVDASESGDLGYTYGNYIFTITDSVGSKKEYKGIFHTVWKKTNGEWKFVWDN